MVRTGVTFRCKAVRLGSNRCKPPSSLSLSGRYTEIHEKKFSVSVCGAIYVVRGEKHDICNALRIQSGLYQTSSDAIFCAGKVMSVTRWVSSYQISKTRPCRIRKSLYHRCQDVAWMKRRWQTISKVKRQLPIISAGRQMRALSAAPVQESRTRPENASSPAT